MLQVDIRSVAFLQNAFVEIISVMDIQIPTTDFRNAHVVSAQFGRLGIPQNIFAICIFVAYFDYGCSYTVDSLPKKIFQRLENPNLKVRDHQKVQGDLLVDIQSIPSISISNIGISFEGFLK